MKPGFESQQLHAFIDGELDLKSQLEIEERLRADAGARAQVEGLRQLKQAVRDNADYHAAPAALRQRLAAPLASTLAPSLAAPVATPVTKPTPQRPGAGAAAALQRWFGWRPLAVSLAMASLMVVVLNLTWMRSMQNDRVLNDVVASHVRSTLGQRLVDVASSDRHTVKPWLSSKLDFSPPVTESPLPGSVFLGGRVDYVDGRPVAALAYQQGRHVVNSYLWPSDGKDRAATFTVQRGFQVAHWVRSGMNHWVISDLGREEFSALVQALQAAGAAR